jgi:hypothetical protein
MLIALPVTKLVKKCDAMHPQGSQYFTIGPNLSHFDPVHTITPHFWRLSFHVEYGLGEGGVDWILRAQDRDQCRAAVNAVMNTLVLAPRS